MSIDALEAPDRIGPEATAADQLPAVCIAEREHNRSGELHPASIGEIPLYLSAVWGD